jgi:hypothetical protein
MDLYLAAIATGTLQIGDTTFENALLVPKFASNLVSVGATPSGYLLNHGIVIHITTQKDELL